MININLKFDNTLLALSGNDFGLDTYRTQIKPYIDMNDMNTIIFSDSIIIISVSFVKGLISDLLKDYTVMDLKEHIKFKCSSKELENDIWNSVDF